MVPANRYQSRHITKSSYSYTSCLNRLLFKQNQWIKLLFFFPLKKCSCLTIRKQAEYSCYFCYISCMCDMFDDICSCSLHECNKLKKFFCRSLGGVIPSTKQDAIIFLWILWFLLCSTMAVRWEAAWTNMKTMFVKEIYIIIQKYYNYSYMLNNR